MKYAIIDIETTGGGRDGHRITEIAIIIHDGVNILDEYQTLVNPESPIPTWIVRLTGITNAMVADAPKFHEVAEKVFAMTYNCVFIAHSVNFDYGIIRNEFSRIGVKFSRQKLCSVRLARKWIPGHRSYSLGKLCQELDITINGRHRAYGDARATVSLMEIIIRRARKSGIDDLTKTPINSDSSIPQKLQGDLSKLSDAPGVVYFHDVTHAVIYVCSASQMLADTLLHIKKLSGSNPDLLKKTDHISSKLTGNELIARLIENNDLYHHSILKNRTSEIKRKFAIYAYEDQNGLMEIKVGKVVSSCKPLAIFQTEQHARMRLDTLALQYELCAKLVDGSNYSKCIYCLSQKCIRNQPLDQKIIRQYLSLIHI